MQPLRKIDKPWGHELLWAHTADYVRRILHIKKSHKLSLQYHERQEETIPAYIDHRAHHVAVGRRHRMIALEDCDVFEVSTNHLDDVVRLDDAYGRAEHARV